MERYMNHNNSLENHRKRINQILANYNYACKAQADEEEALAKAKAQEKHTLEAQAILQDISRQVQEIAHEQIASVVTRCLEAVFQEDAYTFKIEFEEKRGRTEAKLLFVKDGNEIDPVDASGGGVIDVASFALRLSCLVLSRPACRRLLVLDEPYKYLSKDYQPYMREMLEILSKEFGVQVILVTHSDLIKCGKVITLE